MSSGFVLLVFSILSSARDTHFPPGWTQLNSTTPLPKKRRPVTHHQHRSPTHAVRQASSEHPRDGFHAKVHLHGSSAVFWVSWWPITSLDMNMTWIWHNMTEPTGWTWRNRGNGCQRGARHEALRSPQLQLHGWQARDVLICAEVNEGIQHTLETPNHTSPIGLGGTWTQHTPTIARKWYIKNILAYFTLFLDQKSQQRAPKNVYSGSKNQNVYECLRKL